MNMLMMESNSLTQTIDSHNGILLVVFSNLNNRDCIKVCVCASVYVGGIYVCVKLCTYALADTLKFACMSISVCVCLWEEVTDVSSGNPMKNEVTWFPPVFEGQGDPLAYSWLGACLRVRFFFFLFFSHVSVCVCVYPSATMYECVLRIDGF